MKINKTKTNRGFKLNTFEDEYKRNCSIQESSLATKKCIWFGVDSDAEGNEVNNGRMHLSQNQIKKLLPFLNKFVETGEL